MGNIVSLFSPGESFSIESHRDQIPEDVYPLFEDLFKKGHGDLLRLLLDKDDIRGVIKMIYLNWPNAGVLRLVLLPVQEGENEVTKELLSQFIRLCFATYRRLRVIYWNLHPSAVHYHQLCQDLCFQELPASSAYTEEGVRFRSFFIERIN